MDQPRENTGKINNIEISKEIVLKLKGFFEGLNNGVNSITGRIVVREKNYSEISQIMKEYSLTFTDLYADPVFQPIVRQLIVTSRDIPCFQNDETWRELLTDFYGEV